MKNVTKNLMLSLLLGNVCLSSDLLYGEAVSDVESVAAESAISVDNKDPATANEYLYGADSYAYTGGVISGQVFVVASEIPAGYKVGILAYKFKDSSKSSEWMNNIIKLMTDATGFVKKKEPVPLDRIQNFDRDCDEILDANEAKFFPATAITDGSMTAEGYGCNFSNLYALVGPNNEVIKGEWLHDPNTELMQKYGVKGAEDAILFRWNNPAYKAPEVATTCERVAATDENGTPVVIAPSLKTTETFVFKGRDFEQFFQVVASDPEVADNPKGLIVITERVIELFKNMPKVAATIIGRMISGETMAVCPIVTEIDGKSFKANLSFDAGTTPEQAKELADRLDDIFRILKDKVTEEMKDKIDAETEKRHAEHQEKLAAIEEQERKAKAIEAEKDPVDLNMVGDSYNSELNTTANTDEVRDQSVDNVAREGSESNDSGVAVDGSNTERSGDVTQPDKDSVTPVSATDPVAEPMPVLNSEDAERAANAKTQEELKEGVRKLRNNVRKTLDDMDRKHGETLEAHDSGSDFGATPQDSDDYGAITPQGSGEYLPPVVEAN